MKKLLIILLAFVLAFFSCTKPKPTPKPVAYFRPNLPEKHYVEFAPDTCPFSFEIPSYYKVRPFNGNVQYSHCWLTFYVPSLKVEITTTYYPINNNLEQLIDDSYALAYKHTIKADDITEKTYINEKAKVYATVFNIKGNAASPMQFHITDSTKNFFRGSLYFKVRPNRDSLQPSIDFIEKDIIHLIETFKWND